MNDACCFQWGEGETGHLQLYENHLYQGSNLSNNPNNQSYSKTNTLTWKSTFLGESSLEVDIGVDTRVLKRRADCVKYSV